MEPVIARKEPQLVKLEKGKTYAWCMCGLSEKQPFCDGRHKTTAPDPSQPISETNQPLFKSLKFTAEEDTEVWLCQCKHTKSPPFCDGTHNTL